MREAVAARRQNWPASCSSCRHRAFKFGEPACPGPVSLMGVPICRINEARCVELVMESLQGGHGGWIVTPNLDHLRRCAHEPEYASLVREANLRMADGMPLIWASRLRRRPLPGRVAGSDLILSLSQALGRCGMRIYLLGGNPGTADAAAAVLRRSCPGLIVAGTACPELGFESDPDQVETIRRDLMAAEPDVVFVALGSPKQERLIQAMRRDLPRAWWLGIGISFSFVCGQVKRAPRWMQRTGLEWVHRLSQEPRRLAGRYLLQGLPFAAKLLLDTAIKRNVQPHFAPDSPAPQPVRE